MTTFALQVRESAADLWENENGSRRAPTPTESLTHSSGTSREGLAMQATRACSVPDCDRPQVARGLCSKHYQRAVKCGEIIPRGKGWKRGRIQHQDGTACDADPCPTCIARFMQYVRRIPSGCWEWTGSTRRNYGRLRFRGKDHGTHRLAYSWFVEPVPDDLTINHLCFNTRCVNPDHLVVAELLVNARRQRSHISTTCKRNHLRTAENVYIEKATGKRKCRPCAADRQRRYRARKAAARDLISAVVESLEGAA